MTYDGHTLNMTHIKHRVEYLMGWVQSTIDTKHILEQLLGIWISPNSAEMACRVCFFFGSELPFQLFQIMNFRCML